MKKMKYFLLTALTVFVFAAAGCGEKSDSDITNKEVFGDDLEPMTDEELEEMEIDANDDDMVSIDTPTLEDADGEVDESAAELTQEDEE